jgi:transcriptional regulator with XRE-family HTH domain
MAANNVIPLCESAEAPKKAAYAPMSEQQKLEAVAHLIDDASAALTKAFFEVVKREQWGKRDLAEISGLNETAIGHILAGRRKNLTIETIALLARAMQKRLQLVLHDLRPHRNHSTNPNKPIGRRCRIARAAGSSAA